MNYERELTTNVEMTIKCSYFVAQMQKQEEKSIVIIGAGPSGVVASLYLSKYKIKHQLFDKATFPRQKVCGESFAGNVLKVLEDIDPQIPVELIDKGIIKKGVDMNFYTFNEKRYIFKIPKTKSAKIQAERYRLDHYLVDKAKASEYCDFQEGVGVKLVEKAKEGLNLTLTNQLKVFADLVVFANGGVGNLLQNFRGQEFSPDGVQFVFAKGLFNQVNVVNGSSAIDFALLKDPFRYGTYLTSLPNGKAILGVMVEEKLLKKNKDVKLNQLFEQSIQKHPYLKSVLGEAEMEGELKTTSLKIGDFKKKFAGDHYLIAGDAAVPLNPVTGMGVMMAMYYGRKSAEAIKGALENENFTYQELIQYDKHCRKKYNSEYRKSNVYTYLQTNHFMFFNKVIAWLDGKDWVQKIMNRLSFGK